MAIALTSGLVEPLDVNLIKISTLPKFERNALDTMVHTKKEIPVFNDLDVIKLKVMKLESI